MHIPDATALRELTLRSHAAGAKAQPSPAAFSYHASRSWHDLGAICWPRPAAADSRRMASDFAPALASVFLEFSNDSPAISYVALEDALQSMVDAGREAWPEIAIDGATFVRHVARRTPSDLDALRSVQAADLFLACGCATGDRSAMRCFERDYLSRVPHYLRSMRGTGDFCDEVRQIVAEKLLVGTATAPPKVAEYSGRGPLAGWLRITTVRTALNLRRARREEPVAAVDPVAGIFAVQLDPQRDYVRHRYADTIAEALRGAFQSLSADQRLVLRLHFVRGLTGDQISRALHIHRATVVRWIARAREDVLRETARRLRETAKLSETEQTSLLQDLQSQLDLSCSQLLGRSCDGSGSRA